MAAVNGSLMEILFQYWCDGESRIQHARNRSYSTRSHASIKQGPVRKHHVPRTAGVCRCDFNPGCDGSRKRAGRGAVPWRLSVLARFWPAVGDTEFTLASVRRRSSRPRSIESRRTLSPDRLHRRCHGIHRRTTATGHLDRSFAWQRPDGSRSRGGNSARGSQCRARRSTVGRFPGASRQDALCDAVSRLC